MYSCSAEKLKWMKDNKTVERAKPVYSSQSEVLQVVNWSTHSKTELPVKKMQMDSRERSAKRNAFRSDISCSYVCKGIGICLCSLSIGFCAVSVGSGRKWTPGRNLWHVTAASMFLAEATYSFLLIALHALKPWNGVGMH